MDVLSAGGEIRLSRQYRWKKGKGLCPADEALGIIGSGISPGARELCSLMGIGSDFEQSAQDLKRVGGLSVSEERLRQVTEAEGRNVREIRDKGQLPATWSAEDARLPDGCSRIYVGVDGVMTPAVTQTEKNKRRKAHVARRRQNKGNLKPLASPKAGSDEKFKEKKIGIFYNQDKTHRHAFATEDTSEKFGPLLRSYARQVGFEKADETICLIDGAVWIYRQVCRALLCLQLILLDFYHLAEHVYATGRCCLGENEAARAWGTQCMALAKASDVKGMLRAIEALGKKVRSPVKKKSVAGLRKYIEQRREILGYARALQKEQDIGSGPTEACCKTLTLRLKRPGMKWDSDNAAAMMNLLAMRESGQWKAYWNQQVGKAA